MFRLIAHTETWAGTYASGPIQEDVILFQSSSDERLLEIKEFMTSPNYQTEAMRNPRHFLHKFSFGEIEVPSMPDESYGRSIGYFTIDGYAEPPTV